MESPVYIRTVEGAEPVLVIEAEPIIASSLPEILVDSPEAGEGKAQATNVAVMKKHARTKMPFIGCLFLQFPNHVKHWKKVRARHPIMSIHAGPGVLRS